jgi:DNA-binding transcriptional ArsR family regulator
MQADIGSALGRDESHPLTTSRGVEAGSDETRTRDLRVTGERPVRVSEIAEAADITERYAYQLLSDLQQAGYVRRSRRGRRNRYRVNPDLALGDPVVEDRSLRELLRLNDQRDSPDEPVVAAPRRQSA